MRHLLPAVLALTAACSGGGAPTAGPGGAPRTPPSFDWDRPAAALQT
ncbi:MAG: hypothetical protein H6Q88_1334, partial [Anaeromyxobacteraceae bacterium]|nr:hypothetical protein [Anaeromyxobacteraceae bacterium]